MRRLFKMTAVAQQALWTKYGGQGQSRLSMKAHIPVYFLVDGDAEDGYELSAVTEDLCGFDMVEGKIRTLYACKRIIADINETGDSDMRKHFTVGTFAWRHIPMPRVEQTLYKVIDNEINRKHYPELIGKYLASPISYGTVRAC